MVDENQTEIHVGLEGVYIAESQISKVDGQAGKLYYRGYTIESLAQNSNFEEVSYLLLYGRLPKKQELQAFVNELRSYRNVPEELQNLIKGLLGKAHPTDIMRTAMSALAAFDGELDDSSPEANLRRSIRIIARTACIAATIGRFSHGKPYVKPDNNLDHASNFLYMLNGKRADPDIEKLMNLMFMLHAEHSSNASTFTTMVAASTLADIYSAVTAGVSALKGPLHGGADEAALKMLRAIGSPQNTEAYINDALENKQKIMGFGHRVYKTYDPRARILKAYLEKQVRANAPEDVKNLAQIALEAEKIMVERLGETKGIWPNVDFFAAPLYAWAEIPEDLFTPIFAASRSLGWCAHVLEYWQNNKLFRPLEKYTGKLDLPYIPIDKR